MNRRKKQMELCRKSKKLRVLKFDIKEDKQFNEIVKIQDDLYKRFIFYKELNEALARR